LDLEVRVLDEEDHDEDKEEPADEEDLDVVNRTGVSLVIRVFDEHTEPAKELLAPLEILFISVDEAVRGNRSDEDQD